MLRTSEPFGIVRVGTMAIAMEAAAMGRRNAVWPRLWPHVVGVIKGGADLRVKETLWLQDYLAGCGRFDLGPEDVQTVQVPRDWAASMLDGRDETAGRAIRQLQEVGLLDLAHKGERGHSSLYVVLPLPDPEPPEREPNPPPAPTVPIGFVGPVTPTV